jgi:hypothetical protein
MSQGRHFGCYAAATDKLKGYDLVKPSASCAPAASRRVDSDSKALTPAEIEEYLAKLDLDGMAKK